MTRKIGRYEILGSLATGGMAEILLARLVGPSGFERPVVIKRIRPDLDHAELVALFLEEARLAAKIRHANVVAVEDLGTDDGAPYLVMEYLEGESLSNMTRRLVTRDERAPFGLIAYIVAEACAGLHAAHELRNQDGELVGLVHRDVSPQNVFVTYDGAVKVVDFGIATTQTSETPSSDANAIRGKSGYMAPEQLVSEEADRRTDIFALGVVLYELLTGHRLFKRFNQIATVRAVLTDPILPPSRVEAAVPPELEAICMRALSRPRDARYATAAEMRRELLVAMRELASEEPSAELAELMVRCFQDRIAEKRVLLRSVREGSIVDHIPEGDIDITIDIPGLEALAGDEASAPPAPRAAPAPRSLPAAAAPAMSEAPRAPPRRRGLGWAILLAMILAVGIAASVRAVQMSGVTASGAAPPTETSAATTTAVEPPAAKAAEPAAGASDAGVMPREPAVAAASATSATSATGTHASGAAPSANRRVRPLPTTQGAPAIAAVPLTGAAVQPAPASVDTARPAPSASTRGFRRFQ